MPDDRADEVTALVEQLDVLLTEYARSRKLVTYSDLGERLSPVKHAQSSRMHAALSELMYIDARAKRGLRSALVVRSGDRRPGPGFFVTAKLVGRTLGVERSFASAEQERVFGEW